MRTAERGHGHQQRRDDYPAARTTVIESEHEACIAWMSRCKTRCQHAAADEDQRTADAGDDPLSEQRMGIGNQAAEGHQGGRQDTSRDETEAHRPSTRYKRKCKRAKQITKRIGGVHRAGLREAPAEIGLHGGQQESIGEAREA
jgi:hypothetical protein